MKHWIESGLLAASAFLALFGFGGLLEPSYFTTFDDSRELATHVLLIGLAGVAFVAWLKR